MKKLLAGMGMLVCVGTGVQAAIREVAWVQFSDRHWINTYYVPSCTDTFEIRARFAQTDTTQTLWCSRTGMATNTTTLFLVGGKLRFDRNTNTSTTSSTDIVAETDYTVVADYAAGTATVNGADAGVTMAAGDFTPTMPVVLGASAMSYTGFGNYNTGKLLGFKVSNSEGTVLHDFVPAYDDARARYGLYDKTVKRFVDGCGPGTFAGADVAADAATLDPEEWIGFAVVDVPEGETRTLTADDVAGFGSRPFVKLGGGQLDVCAAMADFAGDIYIREGVYRATDTGSFGTVAGRTYVVGGTLLSTVGASTTWSATGGNPAYGSEWFYLRGTGHDNKGAGSSARRPVRSRTCRSCPAASARATGISCPRRTGWGTISPTTAVW
ncbi:MAG: hypothetical protein ACI4Q3_09125 [Kiritimatiellia bacterium]